MVRQGRALFFLSPIFLGERRPRLAAALFGGKSHAVGEGQPLALLPVSAGRACPSLCPSPRPSSLAKRRGERGR